MNKGVVVKHHFRYTIVLRRDGSFVKAKPIKEKSVGAEVTYEEKEAHKLGSLFLAKPAAGIRLLAMVMVLLLIASPLYLWNAQDKAYAYVSIDINPSVELEVNKDMEVISIHAVNDDAKSLISMLGDWKGKPIDQITGQIVQISKKENWLSEEKTVLIGISYEESGEKEAHVTKVLDEYFKKDALLTVAIFEVPPSIRAQAQEQKKSMNEVMAASLPSLTKSELANQMDDKEREIIRTYFDYKKQTVKKEKAIPTEQDTTKEEKKETSSKQKQDMESIPTKEAPEKTKTTMKEEATKTKQKQKITKSEKKEEKPKKQKTNPNKPAVEEEENVLGLDLDEAAIREALLEWKQNPEVIPPILKELPEQIKEELEIHLEINSNSIKSIEDIFDLLDR
ncbi:anti-sigma-I factor RsgI family protein [Radiobacillus deserti]|uniref:RsgI N-terminal anti-sigma domain-containing protein n=1 Tax=Radiobacillus deserti TaxID=2594883 RepID=A0A516KDZ3_9BACI|nr:hypothetical protein [Radiobacillus deserti]QDP39632.1 hypothetical protein FN924_05240 [Radiobacillus deserti]